MNGIILNTLLNVDAGGGDVRIGNIEERKNNCSASLQQKHLCSIAKSALLFRQTMELIWLYFKSYFNKQK